jgi:peptide/nickel transport system permease protein
MSRWRWSGSTAGADTTTATGWLLPCLVLAIISIACLIIPALSSKPATGGFVVDSHLPPFTAGHLLGTDSNGNDLLARLAAGGRTSLQIAFSAVLLSLAIGSILGALGALSGGFLDGLISRFLDAILAFPSLVLALAIALSTSPGKLQAILILTAIGVPAFGRIARAATLQIRNQAFMISASLSGVSLPSILRRHVLPLIAPQLATYALLRVGSAILLEGALSLLGMGVPAPEPSWGNMIADGQRELLTDPQQLLFAGFLMFLAVLSINVLGDRLREHWHRR